MTEALGLPTHRTRLATVHYKDTGRTAPEGTTTAGGVEVAKTTLTSDAFLLEDEKDMAKRLGGEFVDVQKRIDAHEPWSDKPITHVGDGPLARVMLIEQTLGNADWRFDFNGNLSFMEGGMKNLEIIRKPDGTELLVAYAFNTAKVVTGAPMDAKLPLGAEILEHLTAPMDESGNDLPMPITPADLLAEAKKLGLGAASPLAKAESALAAFPFGSDAIGRTAFKKRLTALAEVARTPTTEAAH